jgi:hypothetical protein
MSSGGQMLTIWSLRHANALQRLLKDGISTTNR